MKRIPLAADVAVNQCIITGWQAQDIGTIEIGDSPTGSSCNSDIHSVNRFASLRIRNLAGNSIKGLSRYRTAAYDQQHKNPT